MKENTFITLFYKHKGLVLRCPVPAKMDHSGTGQVQFLDGHCILSGFGIVSAAN
jgi:prepilin-type processing-associated H-X9-DG protein